jgi:hypothetical protein
MGFPGALIAYEGPKIKWQSDEDALSRAVIDDLRADGYDENKGRIPAGVGCFEEQSF